MTSNWLRVSKSRHCPICGKPDYCGISADGEVAICMRVESDKSTRNGGWLHRLGAELPPERHRRRLADVPAGSPTPAPLERRAPSVDFEGLQRVCVKALTWQHLEQLAAGLRVSMTSLRDMGLGWHDGRAYSFPMHDGGGTVVGLRLRALDGRKWAVTGSRNGLFVNQQTEGSGTVFVCEGASDTAAMLGLGLEAVGVPGAGLCVEMLKTLLHRRDVVVMVDRDPPPKVGNDKTPPGLRGANRIAAALSRVCRSVRLLYPRVGKDVREWFSLAHPTAAAVLAAARARRCY